MASPDQQLPQSEANDFDKLKEIEQAQRADDLNILNRVQSLEGKVVLDLGCGTGNYTYKLAERVGPTGRVIGVDPDRERIKIAREKWSRDNLTFIEGDDQTFPEDQYDLVFSNFALPYIKNQTAAFEKIYKNIRPGGQFAFTFGNRIAERGEEMSALMGTEGHKAINSLWNILPTEKYKEIATTVGFEVSLMEEDYDCLAFENVDALFSSWHGITHGRFDVSKADQTKVEAFRKKYMGNVLELKTPVLRMILTKSVTC